MPTAHSGLGTSPGGRRIFVAFLPLMRGVDGQVKGVQDV